MFLVVGYKGNMGKRYTAILDYLCKKWVGIDIEDNLTCHENITRIIIATPTESHFKNICDLRCIYNAPILCEKPISKNIKEAELLKNILNVFVVNNWAFAIDGKYLQPMSHSIYYNYYNTGPHGMDIDCVQLYYLASQITLKNDSPLFRCTIDNKKITLEDIQASYIHMINAFIKLYISKLWDTTDAYNQLLEVLL